MPSSSQDSAPSEKGGVWQTFVRDVQRSGARHNSRAARVRSSIAREFRVLAAAFRVRALLNKFCSAVAACLHFAPPSPPFTAAFRRVERCALMGPPNS